MVQPKPAGGRRRGQVAPGVTGDAAMIVVGGTLITVTGKGDLRVGERLVILGVEPMTRRPDQRLRILYLSTTKAQVGRSVE